MFFEEFERGGGCIGCMYYEQNELGYFKCVYPWFDATIEKDFCKNCNSIVLKSTDNIKYSFTNKIYEFNKKIKGVFL